MIGTKKILGSSMKVLYVCGGEKVLRLFLSVLMMFQRLYEIQKARSNSLNYQFSNKMFLQIFKLFLCVGLPKTAEHLFLAALFFVSFFWASKRKKRE